MLLLYYFGGGVGTLPFQLFLSSSDTLPAYHFTKQMNLTDICCRKLHDLAFLVYNNYLTGI